MAQLYGSARDLGDGWYPDDTSVRPFSTSKAFPISLLIVENFKGLSSNSIGEWSKLCSG